jgi:cell division protein FtsW (lipid II flippase)
MPPSSRTLARLPWLAIASASVIVVAGLGGLSRGDDLYGGSPMVPRQLVWIGLGVAAAFAAAAVPYRRLKAWAYPLMAICLALLTLVLLNPPRNGSRSWFALGPLTFQPSEFSKLAYVLAISRYLMHARHHRTLLGLLAPVLLTLPTVALILREPDLGTASVFLPILFCVLASAGAKLRHFAILGLCGAALTPLVWRQLNAEQRSRITATFRQTDGGGPRKGDEYHLHQSKQVIALGGVWGSDLAGEAVADAEAYQLPAARTDFVFCLVAERWGVGGCAIVLAAYLGLIASALRTGANCEDSFGQLVCVGIAAWFGTQAVINTGMTVGLVPITGITLPLMSYGGSSLLSSALALGVLASVSLNQGYEAASRPFAVRARRSGLAAG